MWTLIMIQNNIIMRLMEIMKYNRYLIEYLNKGGHQRQTYVEAIDEESARKGFFIYNDGTITSISHGE